MQVFDGEWLEVSMYDYDYFVEHGVIEEPDPERNIPEPGQPELYHIAADPEERFDLAQEQPERVRHMQLALENWFDAVEAERKGAER